MNKVPNKSDIENLYGKGATISEVAKELGFSAGCIHKYMCLYEIQRRSRLSYPKKPYPESARKRISEAHKGKTVSEETRKRMAVSKKKGGVGHKKIRVDGYIAIYFPDHPKANKDGYIMEHILVMECALGRWIAEDEVVHHKNHDRSDNRLENLEVMKRTDHMALHTKERHLNGGIKHYTKRVKDLTTGILFDSVKDAADSIGTSSTHVSRVCRGERKSTKGHCFSYV